MAAPRPVPGTAGIVLAGGLSSRMGTSKAALDWHGSPLLAHVAGIVAQAVAGPVVIARAPGQDLPAVPDVEYVDDPVGGRGPMRGIAAGLTALAGRAERAFVCSTDLPLLRPAYVEAVLALLGPDLDVVMPTVHGHPQPLAAAYRTAIAPHLHALLAAGRGSPARDLDGLRVARPGEQDLLTDPALAAADPGLGSVRGANRPSEYAALRELDL